MQEDSGENIDLTPMGGTPPYTYQWSDGSTEEDRTNLPNGTYDVAVTDANGCVVNETFVVDFIGCENVEIDIIYIDDVKESAEGAADGSCETVGPMDGSRDEDGCMDGSIDTVGPPVGS